MPDIPSRVREIATSAMIVVILAVVVLFNLPASAITRAMAPVVNSIALPLGLDQNWALFAPRPPTRQDNVEVHVWMASGATRTWTLPKADPVFGVPAAHRWRKLKETLVTTPNLRPDFVHWAVRSLTPAGDRPVYVEMVLRTVGMPPPGSKATVETGFETLYTEDLAGPR
ncbi:hypothetical protein [Mycobacterium sp. 1274761.0]|uniref:hypothetical protein n=1 Tax=Mycobacterium sp. 1274761.0 TaxID=1834077 RepID=UPI0012E8D934|nr:hypothetical protein [Mycobacterium sp. 1274761.0]